MEEELVKEFVKELIVKYDYTDLGIGKALAFLYENLEGINKSMGDT